MHGRAAIDHPTMDRWWARAAHAARRRRPGRHRRRLRGRRRVRHVVARRRRPRRQPGPPGRRQLRQRLQRRRPRHRRRPRRPAAARRVRARSRPVPSSGPRSPRSASPPSPASSLAATTSWWLLAVGAAAIAAAWFYTGGPRPYGYAGLGEVFVFVFFGLVATVGTTYVAVERITGLSVVMGCARRLPGLLAAGRQQPARHPGRHGRPGSARSPCASATPGRAWLYVALLVAAGRARGRRRRSGGRGCCWRCSRSPVARPPVGAVRGGARGPALIPVLGATGRLQLVFGALATLGRLARSAA